MRKNKLKVPWNFAGISEKEYYNTNKKECLFKGCTQPKSYPSVFCWDHKEQYDLWLADKLATNANRLKPEGETLGDTSCSEQKSVECVNSTIAKAPDLASNRNKSMGESSSSRRTGERSQNEKSKPGDNDPSSPTN